MTVTQTQIRRVAALVEWYLGNYHLTSHDLGTADMLVDPARVGYFAVDRGALEAGEGDALFRVLVCVTMFQRRQDAQVLRILRGIPASTASELSNQQGLVRLAASNRCAHGRSNEGLLRSCDLSKEDGRGVCAAKPRSSCYLKRHTEVLKRYGHFGKVPTSAALVVSRFGDLGDLYRRTLAGHECATKRADALERELVRIWRVNAKIATMFLSAIATPDLSRVRPPWRTGIDWTQFVVVDSNVDLALSALGFSPTYSYEARRSAIQALARRIDLRSFSSGLESYNPRLIQQAMYLFFSKTNRRASEVDCSLHLPPTCTGCDRFLRRACPVRG